jgi:hypothetical protein
VAFEDVTQRNIYNIFSIYENNTEKIRIYFENYRIKIKNLINNEVNCINVNSINMNRNTFYNLVIDIETNQIKVYLDNNQILSLNSNPFNNGKIMIKSNPNNSKNTYIRNVYFNLNKIEIIKDKLKVNNEEIEFNKNEWNRLNIIKTPNSIYYKINSNFITSDFPNNFTETDYKLNINLTQTSIYNLRCIK